MYVHGDERNEQNERRVDVEADEATFVEVVGRGSGLVRQHGTDEHKEYIVTDGEGEARRGELAAEFCVAPVGVGHADVYTWRPDQY